MADLGPESLLGCELRQEGQGQVGVEKDICLGVPRHSSNPIMNTESKQQELPARVMGPNLVPESWNIPAIPSRARGGSVRRS